MKIAFRTDSSAEIGTGHFMRCLTLADALKFRGAQTRFVCRHLPDESKAVLESRGHEHVQVGGGDDESSSTELQHSLWLGTSQQADAQASVQALLDHDWDWLVVDHYALDARWETTLRKVAKHILVIDDIADRLHDCDMLLDQNYYADMDTRYSGKVPERCRLLLGPRYALLREEFMHVRAQVQPRTGRLGRVLVFFGGVDAGNYTALAVHALSGLSIAPLQVDVVVGEQHPAIEQIRGECLEQGFSLHVQTDKMGELMAAADMAIGAGGTATWERCCLGLPAFAIATADNQRQQVADAAAAGLLHAPRLEGDLTLAIQQQLHVLAMDRKLRQAISIKSMQTVDAKGMLRIVAKMDLTGISVRPANINDSLSLFAWRNYPSIRAVSRNTGVIDQPTHEKWFTSVLGDPNRILLIGHLKIDTVGVVRFDIQNDKAEVSIYLVPEKGMDGRGGSLLKQAENWLLDNRPDVSEIRACVVDGNERSQQLFLKSGYDVASDVFFKKISPGQLKRGSSADVGSR